MNRQYSCYQTILGSHATQCCACLQGHFNAQRAKVGGLSVVCQQSLAEKMRQFRSKSRMFQCIDIMHQHKVLILCLSVCTFVKCRVNILHIALISSYLKLWELLLLCHCFMTNIVCVIGCHCH